MKLAIVGALLVTAALPFTTSAAASASVLKVAPPHISFGTKPVGSFTLKGTTITNTGDTTVNLLVTASRLPDNFSFGLLPGSTCPVLEPAPLAPGASCDAVMGFRPSEFFAGQRQRAVLLATATDPESGAVVGTAEVVFTGRGK
jgi:hypothetical protein